MQILNEIKDLGEAITARIGELGAITDVEGEVTRLYLSAAHRRAVDVVINWMRDAGMDARLDAIGNVIGSYAGANAKSKTLLLASHIDTVRNAGKYDGTLGVIAAIEIVRRLRASGRRMPFAIEIAAFGDEEGVRFSSTLSGSRALAGKFDAKILDETDENGITRRAALKAFGCPEMPAGNLARAAENYLGYVELHIEQGPVLEARDLPAGVVTAINGASRGSVAVTGLAGHAGTVPMAMRRDALAAAAEMVLAVEARARGEPGLVATIGQLATPGGAVNTVPGRVEFTLDIRAPSDAGRLKAAGDITALTGAIAAARGVTAVTKFTYQAQAAPCDAGLSDMLAQSLAHCGMTPFHLPSGAGHDAMAFRGVMPIAMLFVRCKGGISHNPAEFASAGDIGAAARALMNFAERLEIAVQQP